MTISSPTIKGPVKTGDCLELARTFTAAEVESFAQVTGDYGRHHIEPDSQGRLVVHGLLTMSIPTILGGQLNFLLHRCTMEFSRPVYTGETIECLFEIESMESTPKGSRLTARYTCTNPQQRVVLRGTCEGLIRN